MNYGSILFLSENKFHLIILIFTLPSHTNNKTNTNIHLLIRAFGWLVVTWTSYFLCELARTMFYVEFLVLLYFVFLVS